MSSILASFLIFIPFVVNAVGLVPCSGPNCQMCSFLVLIKNVSNWLVFVMGFIAALLLVYAGIRTLLFSGGGASSVQAAKTIAANTIVGYLILVACWVLVGFFMSLFLPGEGEVKTYGMWDAEICVDQPDLQGYSNSL